LKAFFYKATK